MNRRRALLLLALLPACFSAGQRREEALTREARTFNDDLRWSRWQAVSGAMPRADGEAFMARVAALEDDLVLADYEVTSMTFGPDARTATVAARIEWYQHRDPRLRSTVLEQSWEFQGGRWQVVKLRRTRGDRLGLVPEPVAAPEPAPPP